MQEIVSAEAMTRRVPEGKLFEVPLEVGEIQHRAMQELAAGQILAESHHGNRRLFCRDTNLSPQSDEDMLLDCIDEFHPVQPRDRQRRRGFLFCAFRKSQRLWSVLQLQIESGEKIRVCVGLHSPAMRRSTMATWLAGIGFGKIRFNRARISGSDVILWGG